MGKPRVFISSTFFDLKQVRESIDNFITSMGFLPIRNEEGQIPYGINDHLDQDCYDEVNQCDILVSIIGSRYGSEATSGGTSVSQRELNYAIELGKQVYIFIDKNVQAEYETYKLNRHLKKMKLKHVDDVKIYQYLDDLHGLGITKPMFPFETARDILKKLQEQWAGLFQRLLQFQEEKIRFNVVERLQNTSDALYQMVGYILEKDENRENYLKIMQKTNHPAFIRLSQVLQTPYKVIFSDFYGLSQYLKHFGFTFPQEIKPGYNANENENLIWQSATSHDSLEFVLAISKNIFLSDNGSWDLKYISFEEWDDSFINLFEISTKSNVASTSELGNIL